MGCNQYYYVQMYYNNALIEHLTTKLDVALSMHPNAGIILARDFNRCPVSTILRHFTLKQIVKQPTRGNAILDLIQTNMSNFCNTIQCYAHIRTLQLKNQTRKIKQGNNAAKTAFGKWLTDFNWTGLYHTFSCEQKLELFEDIINAGLDCFLPTKTVKLHEKDKPWVTPEFKKIIEARQKAFHDGKSSHYRRLCNQINRETKKLRSTFLEKKLAQLKLNPNPKKWWQSIRQLSGYPRKKVLSTLVVGNQVVSGKTLAENVNDAFVSITKEIPPLNRLHTDILSENNHFDISPEFIINGRGLPQTIHYINFQIPWSRWNTKLGFKVIRPCTRFPCSINFQRLYPASDRSDHLEKS